MDYERNLSMKTPCSRVNPKTVIIVIAAVCLCVSLGLVIVVAILASSRHVKDKDICLTKPCIKAAALLLKSMNRSVDPCVDFYEFTCGNWIQDHKFLDPTGSEGILSQMQLKTDSNIKDLFDQMASKETLPKAAKMALNAYTACLNDSLSVDYTAMKEIITAIGGWPILEGSDWNDSNYKWEDSVAKLLGLLGVDSVFNCGVDLDFKNTSRYIVMLDQPEELEDEKISKDSVRSKLLNIIKQMTDSNVTDHWAKDLEDIEAIEKLVKKLSRSKEERRSPSTMYHKMTIAQVQSLAPKINWIYFFTVILDTAIKTGHRRMTLSEEILVVEPEYIRQMSVEMTSGNYSKRAIANYIGWTLVANFMFAIPDHKTICPPHGDNLKWDEQEERDVNKEDVRACINKVTQFLNLASDYLIFRSSSDGNLEAEGLLSNIQNAFRDRLKRSKWINEKVKKPLQDKVNNITARIGFPRWILNGTKLNEFYKDLSDLDSDNLNNFMNIVSFITRKEFEHLNAKSPPKEWIPGDSMRQVNAFYIVHGNRIVLPMSILSPPMFNGRWPWYMNYGGIGFIIGHELTHGFDDEGMKWDVKGHLNPGWLPDYFREKYESRSQCFVDQFENFSPFGIKLDEAKKLAESLSDNGKISLMINGSATLGENIADSGGLIQSFEAYQNWKRKHGDDPKLPGLEKFTSDQMFFISFGATWCSRDTFDVILGQLLHDEHSPEKFRIIGSVSNSKHFAETFHCPSGSPMNPAKKCILW